MTTIRHCSILEFGRGASNQVVAPGITRPLHAAEKLSVSARLLAIVFRTAAHACSKVVIGLDQLVSDCYAFEFDRVLLRIARVLIVEPN